MMKCQQQDCPDPPTVSVFGPHGDVPYCEPHAAWYEKIMETLGTPTRREPIAQFERRELEERLAKFRAELPQAVARLIAKHKVPKDEAVQALVAVQVGVMTLPDGAE